jgi:hypothetical protein
MGAANFKFPTVSNPWKKFSVTVAKMVPVQAVKAYGERVVAPFILKITTGWRVTCAYVYIYICCICIYACVKKYTGCPRRNV